MNYSLRQLRIFVTVVQAKSFSQVGDIIGLSQSAVSHNVKESEGQTGVWSLDKTTWGAVLTEAGHQLAARLECILDELHSMLREAGQVGMQLTGTARVVASQTISTHFIPQCIAQNNQLYPAIDFVLHDRLRQRVLESIYQDEVDFGIAIDPGAVTGLQCEAVLSEPFLLPRREDHPLIQREWANWQDLYHERLVLQDYVSDSQPLIDAALTHFSIEANIVQEMGHPAMFFPMVETGIGVSVPLVLAFPLPQSSHLQVKHLTPVVERQLMLAQRKNRSLLTAAQALWDVVRMQASELTAGRARDSLYQL